MLSRLGLIVLLLSTVSSCEKSPEATLSMRQGDIFPHIQLIDLFGKPVSLGSFTGKIIVINFWATWCGPCREELPSLQRLYQSLDKNNFVIVGISIDEDEQLVREYLLDKGITFPNYVDVENQFRDILGVHVFPTTFLLRDNRVIHRIIEGAQLWDKPIWIKLIKSMSV